MEVGINIFIFYNRSNIFLIVDYFNFYSRG